MAKFRQIPVSEIETQLQFWCPACNEIHALNDTWAFNGNLESPTVNPSVRVTWLSGMLQKENICHSFIKDGNIQFLNDCTHNLAGQTVILPDVNDKP